jgi:hypothetical protein
MTEVEASRAYYIKLGRAGNWETECLKDGTLRFGYRESPHDQCLRGDWQAVWAVWNEIRKDEGAATRDVKQIRVFYEADETTIFITFVGLLLYWCRPSGPVEVLPDGGHRRQTVDGWHSTSLGGARLTTDRLSGHLLKVQMFRGTICEVRAFDYLLRKLGDELLPEVADAWEAERALLTANSALMRLLTWQDFELLVDLVFSASGWRRISVVGKTQKTVDLELVLTTTSERAFVQVKSEANDASVGEYIARLGDMPAFDRMFFVWHTGSVDAKSVDSGKSLNPVTLVGPERLSRMVLDAGLSSWLREKAS